MTQEDKELLLKDLCARLPYGVKIHINSCIEEQNHMQLFDVNLEVETIGVRNEKWTFRAIPIIDDEDETKVIKPYLRPMSSMTEEENLKLDDMEFEIAHLKFTTYAHECMILDYLYSRHLDVRGLIPMGLALEAPKDMYKI